MPFGEAVPMLDSESRVRGTLEYLVNLILPDMLVGKIVRSTVPHARLLRVDVSQAMEVSGVVAIMTGEDIAGHPRYGMVIKDQPILAVDRVRFIGEPVAAIAAETIAAAEQAAALVEISYEELPGVFDELEATQPGTTPVHDTCPDNVFKHAKLRHGDVAAGFAAADEIFEDTFTSPVAQHVSMEPHVTAAQWDGKRLKLWSATQAPHRVREALAGIFAVDPEDIRVIVSPLGGGYGGKGHIRIEPIVAALAQKTAGRPVKITLAREEEFVTVTKHAATLMLKTGVRRDGTFTARQATIHWNGGAYADASAFLVTGGMVRSLGPYRIPAAWVDSYGVYTNLPPAAAFRGAMSSQTTWAYESQMDMIAQRMGWDPLEFRRKNLLQSGDPFATGEILHDVHFQDCLDAVAQGIGWYEHPEEAGDRVRKRGRGLAVMMKSTAATSKSQSRLEITPLGEVRLFTSSVEMGQGIHTTLAQIGASALGVPLQDIRVIGPDTDETPFDSTTSASRSTSMMGGAVTAAAEDLKGQLISLAAPILETEPGGLTASNGKVWVMESGESIPFGEILQRNQLEVLSAFGETATQGGLDPETGQGISTPHWHQGAGAAEIEVDLETGQVTILRYYASSYAGRVVNPQLARLQNDGNVIYGLGPAIMEEMIFDSGQLTTANLSEYLIPSIRDIPQVLESVCIESLGGEIHGIGEMTLPPVAPAIANAIADATGVRIKDLPITAEKVLRAILESAHGEINRQ